jgi:hypothetical protein
MKTLILGALSPGSTQVIREKDYTEDTSTSHEKHLNTFYNYQRYDNIKNKELQSEVESTHVLVKR